MLEQMPDAVFDYWCAYQRLQNPEYRQSAEWDAMNEKERIAVQSDALRGIISSGKAIAEKRSGR